MDYTLDLGDIGTFDAEVDYTTDYLFEGNNPNSTGYGPAEIKSVMVTIGHTTVNVKEFVIAPVLEDMLRQAHQDWLDR